MKRLQHWRTSKPLRRPRDAGVWEPLRPLLERLLAEQRRLRAEQNNPHYVWNGNEQPTLAQLITAAPPVGGVAALIRDMDRGNNEGVL